MNRKLEAMLVTRQEDYQELCAKINTVNKQLCDRIDAVSKRCEQLQQSMLVLTNEIKKKINTTSHLLSVIGTAEIVRVHLRFLGSQDPYFPGHH